MKNSLQLKFNQSLHLTPQLQQSIKILQLSSLDLRQEISKVIIENPLIETIEEENDNSQSNDKNSNDRDIKELSHRNKSNSSNEFDDQYQNLIEEHKTPQRIIKEQLLFLRIQSETKEIVEFLIDNLDDKGYLIDDLEELRVNFQKNFNKNIDKEHFLKSLEILQNLDPAGIGARTVSECLLIQSKRLNINNLLREKIDIVLIEYLHLLERKDYTKLRKHLKVNDIELKEINEIIINLEPKPLKNFDSLKETNFIIPDVVAYKEKNSWNVRLNSNSFPKIKINQNYANIIKSNGSNSELNNSFQEAKWFIKSIEQRQETILRVSKSIVKHQKRFFEDGEIAMKPLILKEIAEELELHESTISRVTTQKYISTPSGVFELKYFFGSHVSLNTGESLSSTATRALIKEIINNENKSKPFSDNQIAKLLGDKNIKIARRTVAKYRDGLNFLPANLRKKL